MLVLPLALSAQADAPRGDEEVVVAAGLAGGAAPLDVSELVEVELAEGEEAAAEAAPADQEVEATSTSGATSRPRTTRRTASTRTAARATTSTSRSSSTATKAAGATAPKAPPPAPATTRPPPPPPPTAAPAPTTGGDAAWDRLAQCESGNTNDPNAPYYGYWQFSAETWQGMGESGLPDQYGRSYQLAVAKRLQAARGWAPWPECARRLGLV